MSSDLAHVAFGRSVLMCQPGKSVQCQAVCVESVRQVTCQLSPATAADNQPWLSALRCQLADRILQPADDLANCTN